MHIFFGKQTSGLESYVFYILFHSETSVILQGIASNFNNPTGNKKLLRIILQIYDHLRTHYKTT